MVDILTFDLSDAERYADILTATVGAVADGDFAAAAESLRPISGELWMGRLKAIGKAGDGPPAGTRPRNETLRAQVFIRDRFRCTFCGGRAVPRSILVAVHDVFPDAVPYNQHYARGKIHPVFWALAPEADHVIPHSRGGLTTLENLTTLHAACNTRKADALAHDLPVSRLAPADERWDGLTSFYAALIAAGAGKARHTYHQAWSRRYERLMTQPACGEE
jgi:hypothetical protein